MRDTLSVGPPAFRFSASSRSSRESTRIVIRDPHAVSLFVVANHTRTLVLPPELPAPAPPTGSVERALWEAHEVAPRRSSAFGVEPAPADGRDSHGEAYRFGPGGISVAYVRGQLRRGAGAVLDDDGVLLLREGAFALRAATWCIDRDAQVALVRLPMFDSNHRREAHSETWLRDRSAPWRHSGSRCGKALADVGDGAG